MFAVMLGRLRQLSAVNFRRVLAEPGNNGGVKTFNAIFPGIAAQGGKRLFAKLLVAPSCLQLHNHRRFAANRCKHFVKQRNFLFGSTKAQFQKLGIIQFVHALGNAANTIQRVVMKNNHLPVAGELNVQLHTVSGFHRFGKRGKRIFGNALVLLVKPAVGKVFAVKRRFFLVIRTGRSKNNEYSRTQNGKNNQNNPNPHKLSISVNGF